MANNLPNYHLIAIKYMGASNTRGSRVKIESLRFPNDSVIVSYDYKFQYFRSINRIFKRGRI